MLVLLPPKAGPGPPPPPPPLVPLLLPAVPEGAGKKAEDGSNEVGDRSVLVAEIDDAERLGPTEAEEEGREEEEDTEVAAIL